MSRKQILLSLLAGLSLVVLLLVGGAWYWVGPGSVKVLISEGDAPPLRLSLPSGILETGLLLLPRDVYADVAEELDEAAPAWRPVLLAACEGLVRCPDGEFLRVESGEDDLQVVVTKKHRRFRVEIHSGREELSFQLPAATLRRCGRILARQS